MTDQPPDWYIEAIASVGGNGELHSVPKAVPKFGDLDALLSRERSEACDGCDQNVGEDGVRVCRLVRKRCGSKGAKSVQVSVIVSTSWLNCPKGRF